jgi:hypothetical protein
MQVHRAQAPELPMSLAVEGMLHGRMIRKSLDIRSWDAAQKMIREWNQTPLTESLP